MSKLKWNIYHTTKIIFKYDRQHARITPLVEFFHSNFAGQQTKKGTPFGQYSGVLFVNLVWIQLKLKWNIYYTTKIILKYDRQHARITPLVEFFYSNFAGEQTKKVFHLDNILVCYLLTWYGFNRQIKYSCYAFV